jgi:hypothetical protein
VIFNNGNTNDNSSDSWEAASSLNDILLHAVFPLNLGTYRLTFRGMHLSEFIIYPNARMFELFRKVELSNCDLIRVSRQLSIQACHTSVVEISYIKLGLPS